MILEEHYAQFEQINRCFVDIWLDIGHVSEMHTTVWECSIQRVDGGDQYMWRRSFHWILQTDGCTEEVMWDLSSRRSFRLFSHWSRQQWQCYLVAIWYHVRGYRISQSGQSHVASRYVLIQSRFCETSRIFCVTEKSSFISVLSFSFYISFSSFLSLSFYFLIYEDVCMMR